MMIYLTQTVSKTKSKSFKPKNNEKLSLNSQLQTVQILQNDAHMLNMCLLYFLLLHLISNFQVFKVLLLQKYLKTLVHEKMNASSSLEQLSLKKGGTLKISLSHGTDCFEKLKHYKIL